MYFSIMSMTLGAYLGVACIYSEFELLGKRSPLAPLFLLAYSCAQLLCPVVNAPVSYGVLPELFICIPEMRERNLNCDCCGFFRCHHNHLI